MGKENWRLRRRAVLAGLVGGGAEAAWALAPGRSIRPAPRPGTEQKDDVFRSIRPEPRPEGGRGALAPSLEDLVKSARLGAGADVSCLVARADESDVLEHRQGLLPQPPASTAKALTALYALDALGAEHRFPTRVLAAGPLDGNGRLDGDLILAGGGDPTLDTNALAELAARLKASGLREISGRFLTWGGGLPTVPTIDPGQPDHLGYSPAVGGLNLNFNRVHFEWRRASSGGWAVSMDARSDRYRPDVRTSRMSVVQRSLPIYTYAEDGGIDRWTVASGALGNGGARWLPVRHPAAYAAEVFQTFARSQGIALPTAQPIVRLPVSATELARFESGQLRPMARDMLKFSTNITAEVLGLAASQARGGAPRDLAESALLMSGWLDAGIGRDRVALVDHSGLGDASRITAADMVRALTRLGPGEDLAPILKAIPMRDANYAVVDGYPAEIRAKTGTLNFVSALAGYITTQSGQRLAFASMMSDLERRAGIAKANRENPKGARGWARRARHLQLKFIDRWVKIYG